MQHYEYRVVAAPTRGLKAKGIRSNEARFAHAIEEMMNSMAQDGWEYQRAETLPSVERSGLTSTTTTWRNMLVFRRPLDGASTDTPKRVEPPLALVASVPDADTKAVPAPIPPVTKPQNPDDDASESEGASRMLRDNGVEELSEVSGVSSSLKQLAENRKSEKSDD